MIRPRRTITFQIPSCGSLLTIYRTSKALHCNVGVLTLLVGWSVAALARHFIIMITNLSTINATTTMILVIFIMSNHWDQSNYCNHHPNHVNPRRKLSYYFLLLLNKEKAIHNHHYCCWTRKRQFTIIIIAFEQGKKTWPSSSFLWSPTCVKSPCVRLPTPSYIPHTKSNTHTHTPIPHTNVK